MIFGKINSVKKCEENENMIALSSRPICIGFLFKCYVVFICVYCLVLVFFVNCSKFIYQKKF